MRGSPIEPSRRTVEPRLGHGDTLAPSGGTLGRVDTGECRWRRNGRGVDRRDPMARHPADGRGPRHSPMARAPPNPRCPVGLGLANRPHLGGRPTSPAPDCTSRQFRDLVVGVRNPCRGSALSGTGSGQGTAWRVQNSRCESALVASSKHPRGHCPHPVRCLALVDSAGPASRRIARRRCAVHTGPVSGRLGLRCDHRSSPAAHLVGISRAPTN
jgi:hypothetical protein